MLSHMGKIPEDLFRQHMVDTLRFAALNGPSASLAGELQKSEMAERMRRLLADEVANLRQNRDYLAGDRVRVRLALNYAAMVVTNSGGGDHVDLRVIATQAADGAIEVWSRRSQRRKDRVPALQIIEHSITGYVGTAVPTEAADRWRIQLTNLFLAAIVRASGWAPATAQPNPEVGDRLRRIVDEEIRRLQAVTPALFLPRQGVEKVVEALYARGCRDPAQLLAKAGELLDAALDGPASD